VNRYEGMFIFPDSLKDEQLDAAVARVKADIEKLGGTVETMTRLGKRTFARRLKRRTAGHYVVIMFRLDGDKVPALRERCRLSEEVFRAEFYQADDTPAPAEAASHGVAE